MGLPAKWCTVMFWLTATPAILPSPAVPVSQKPRIFNNIPILQDYEKAPQESFWQSFPFNNLPTKPETKINTVRLSELIEENKHLLLKSELARAR